MAELSIIIPALNEAEALPSTLDAIRPLGAEIEKILVDGGSKDDTPVIAEAGGCRVLCSSRPGRALQMNLGAENSSSEILLFLHADTSLPERGILDILDAMTDPAVAGGGFVRVFDSPSIVLKLTTWFAARRNRKHGLFLGDQAIFVRRKVFDELDGYDESRAICEDLDFSNRLRKSEKGRIVALPGPLVSSARRFDRRGPLIQSVIDCWLTRLYFRGRL